MNKLMKLIIFLLTGALFGCLFTMPIIVSSINLLTGLEFNLINIFKVAIDNFASDWQMFFSLLPFVLLLGIPLLCLLAIGLKTFFGLFGRKRRIKIKGASITIFILVGLLIAIFYFLPRLLGGENVTLPDWIPDSVVQFLVAYLLITSNAELGLIIYLFCGFGIVAIVLAAIGNAGVTRGYKHQPYVPQTPYAPQAAYAPQPPVQQPMRPQPTQPVYQSPQIYCRSCGTPNVAGSQFCSRCGSRL